MTCVSATGCVRLVVFWVMTIFRHLLIEKCEFEGRTGVCALDFWLSRFGIENGSDIRGAANRIDWSDNLKEIIVQEFPQIIEDMEDGMYTEI